MTLEEAVIALVRVLGSLPVLRWPFFGGLLAILVDLSDLFLMNGLHLGGVNDYQSFDKWLDQVYMLTFLVVALRWQGAVRRVAVGLYACRLLGFLLFEATGERDLIILFPNVFEFWFLLVAWLRQRRPNITLTTRGTLLALGGLLVAKEAQELILHYFRLLDSFTAFEAVGAVYDFVTGPFR